MKNIIKYYNLIFLSTLIVACGGSGGSGSSNPTSNGSLSFNKTTIPVTTGSTQTVSLSFSSTVANATANIDITSANTQIATVTPSTCSLNNSTTAASSCQVTVHGVADGSTSLTASASGYSSATANVSVSTAAVPGNIVFSESSTPIYVGESSTAFVVLDSSSGVTGETVNFTSSNPTTITVTPSCSLSTDNNYCQITLNATATATATITATSTTSGESTMLAIASTTPTVGNLTITPGSVLIAAQSGSQSNPATITLANSAGVHNLWVSVAGNTNANVATPGNITQNNIPVGYCCLSSNPESNTCNFNAVGAGAAGTTTISWQAVANGVGNCPSMGADYSAYSQPELTVTAATIVPTARTFNIINKCSYPVYFGISGGAVGNSASSQADCPTNSTYVESKSTCFWNNPTPTGGNYTLAANGGTTSVTIPASNYNGQEWSGGIAGRTNCTESGLCETGGCTGTVAGTGGTSGLACAVTHGFSIPNSAAEFTLLSTGNDAYDVTLIGGVIVPVSMQPSNNTIVSTANPYQCGNAGSVTAQYGFFNGTPQTLYAASWMPEIPTTSGTTVTTPAEAYNYVSGTSAGNTSCSNGTSGNYTPDTLACTTPGSSGSVCGYTYDAINQPSPTYKYTCGTRIGWISAATVYAANESITNVAPFGFDQIPNPSGSNPNNYTIGQWSQCVHPPFDSSYQVGSPDAQTCGGTNWTEIATPESGFMSSNLVWQQEILTRITWIKKACPTCYSYQFDDNSSSFTCQTQASSTNPANATNYTVTFCPAN